MKKILLALAVCAFIVSSCGMQTKAESEETQETTAIETPAVEATKKACCEKDSVKAEKACCEKDSTKTKDACCKKEAPKTAEEAE